MSVSSRQADVSLSTRKKGGAHFLFFPTAALNSEIKKEKAPLNIAVFLELHTIAFLGLTGYKRSTYPAIPKTGKLVGTRLPLQEAF